MKPEIIELNGCKVSLQFLEDHGDAHVGFATHRVLTSDLEDGTALGPWDNDTFVLRGEMYLLGAHDYETNGEETTCTAPIYSLDEPDETAEKG